MLDEDPRLQDVVSREQAQALETDTGARIRNAQLVPTHQDRSYVPWQRVLVWRRQVLTSSAHAQRSESEGMDWARSSGAPTRNDRVVSMRARNWKCTTDRLRLASADEEDAAHLISRVCVISGFEHRADLRWVLESWHEKVLRLLSPNRRPRRRSHQISASFREAPISLVAIETNPHLTQ